MSRVRNRDTDIECAMRSLLFRKGLRFRKHVRELPGRPDIVLARFKVVVFVDGDFWHGYRFPQWSDRVSEFWREKIEGNRRRDQRNFRKLRRMGWRVIRIWQHQIENDIEACVSTVIMTCREE